MPWLPQDEARLRIILSYIFGYSLIAIYIGLVIASRMSETRLDMFLEILGPLVGMFATFAFTSTSRKD